MENGLAVIGFGEAAQAFSGGWSARVFDIATDGEMRSKKYADYRAAGVTGCDNLPEALRGSSIVLSLVTADQASAACDLAARHIAPGTIFCDLNSVAPETKRESAIAVTKAKCFYVDVAIMAPVHPGRRATPLLVSGEKSPVAAARLRKLGFSNVHVVGAEIGRASAIKMIRSVLVKGLEALTAECILAAEAAGVTEEVITSLNASWPGTDWAERTNYNLERMMVHGLRRAAEMEEVVKTLNALGTGGVMSLATALWQREIGARDIPPAACLTDNVAAILVNRDCMGKAS